MHVEVPTLFCILANDYFNHTCNLLNMDLFLITDSSTNNLRVATRSNVSTGRENARVIWSTLAPSNTLLRCVKQVCF